MDKKLKLLENVLNDKSLSGIYISNSKTIFYLFGLDISNGHFVISKTAKYFVTDGRYIHVVRNLFEKTDVKVVDVKNLESGITSVFEMEKLTNIGLEFEKITLSAYHHLKNKNKTVEYVSVDTSIEMMRLTKSDEEISIITEGVKYHEEIFSSLHASFKEGVTELEIKKMFDCGALDVTPLGTSFETIVAFGENSAKPHHHSTARKLKKGDTILIDSGINYKGYATDMTRTCFFHSVNPELEKAYELVSNAVKIAEENIVVGDYTSTPHKKVVEYFKQNQVNEYYLHSLGHGVGIDIHESPGLGLKDNYKFQESNVFTIEPGLYYENIGGIRLENMYFISTQGLKKFNNLDYNIRVV